MPKNAWPTGTDVLALLNGIPEVSEGLITAPSVSDCSDLAEGVIDDFQEMTGRFPFLSTGIATLRTFDPPDGRSGRLRLPVQLLSVQSLYVDVTPTSTGTLYTQGLDFLLGDANAPAYGQPYEWIDFINWVRGIYGCPQSLQITAVWGYSLTVPMDAWQAVRSKAAARALEKTMSLSGPLRAIKQRSQTREYGIRGQRTLIDDLGDEYDQVVSKYTYIARE